MRLRHTRNQTNQLSNSDAGLIADFQTALMTLSTIEGAKAQATQAELTTLQQFAVFRQTNQPYVLPQDVPLAEHEKLTRASLDAHLQKVQSEQIEQYGADRIASIRAMANATYQGKKVRVRVLYNEIQPLHNCWRDKLTGQLYFAKNQSMSITGTLQEINLLENYIRLAPTLGRKFVNQTLEYYLVEILEPASLHPMVAITLI